MYDVWAPNAKRLELEADGQRYPMVQGEHGWWKTKLPITKRGDYGYRIDDGPVLPDPRSAWQPNGVNQLSRSIDPRGFAWTDHGFQASPLSAAVIYELHIGTFTPDGTFTSAIERLDHLAELGVTHVEIMPVAQWDGPRGWGYDGVDLFAPHQAYGGPDALKQLVNACHNCGLAVLLDVVYNHLGPSGNYLPRFGPYFSDRHHTGWGTAVNFDGPGSDEVRNLVIDNALMWLRDYHIDGLRLDAVHAIVDTSAYHILEELAARIDQLEAELGRHLVVIAESDLNDPRLVRSPEAGGYGLDAHWSDDVHHTLHALITGQCSGYYCDFREFGNLAAILKSPYIYNGRRSGFRQRRHGRSPEGLPGHRFVACLQNHDQVGNQGRGERLCHLAGIERAKVGAALLLTSPYVPLLFQGEEWAASAPFQYFTSFSDQQLGQAVTKGRRREMASLGWRAEDTPDPQGIATFERSKLNWEELGRDPHRKMLAWYQKLIALRRCQPTLTSGKLDQVETTCDPQRQWIRIWREPVTIAANLGPERHAIPLPCDATASLLLASTEQIELSAGRLLLPPDSVAILGPTEDHD